MDYQTELTFTLKNTEYMSEEDVEQNGHYGDLTVELLTPTSETDNRLEEIEARIAELDICIDNLTNHADKLDYAVSVASGIVSGVIDILFVGKFDLDEGIDWSSERINEFVIKMAKSQGCTKNDLRGAISFLEGFGSPSDKAKNIFGGARQHHLRDFAHHASPIGLFFSMLTQFTKKAYGTDTAGRFIITDVVNLDFIGKDKPQKFLFGMIYWIFHMASDMAGSSGTAGGGTGVPGPIMSLVKLLSTIPIFKDKDGVNELSKIVSKLFNGTLLAEKEGGKIVRGADGKAWVRKMDLRGELGVLYEVGKQSIPIIANEMFVRGFYFINRLIDEMKSKESLHSIEWEKTIPFNNRTIARMMTISLGTFHAVDVIDAAIEGAVHSKGQWAEFGRQAVLRLNFVGIGRFTIALGNEAIMGWKRYRRTKERLKLKNEALCLMEVKLYRGDVLLWQAAKDADESINSLFDTLRNLSQRVEKEAQGVGESLLAIQEVDVTAMDEHNAGLTDEILDIL